jgi:hypothetical protein
VFSKRARVAALKNKSANTVTSAYENEILNDGNVPVFLQTDKGSEFVNSKFQNMLKRHNVKFYTSESELKASVVERFNKTLKQRIYQYMTYTGKNRYVDVLDKIVSSYNNTYHRSIGMKPIDVTEENSDSVASRLYPEKPKKITYKFKIGNAVRISTSRWTFKRGYTKQWTDEIFLVTELFPSTPVTYCLSDMDSEPIKGRFYNEELQLAKKPTENDYFQIEKVIKTRKVKGKKQYFVKWLGYPPKFNSWINSIKRL